MKPSDTGYLTVEQKQARDLHQDSMHQTMLGNYLIDQSQQAMRVRRQVDPEG